MQALLAALGEWADFGNLEEGLRGGASHLRVRGLEGSAKAFILAGLFLRLARPGLLLAPDPQQAERLYDDLSALSPSNPTNSLRIALFPSLDGAPYEDASPDKDRLRERLQTLWRLAKRGQERSFKDEAGRFTLSDLSRATPREAEGTKAEVTSSFIIHPSPLLVITTPEAALSQTLPRARLLSAAIEIKKGETISREDLADLLVRAGYKRQELVEEPGEFSLRGGVIDIWPSNLESPVRIEEFGEEIESLRHFDPATQRSHQPLESAVILPARELLLEAADLQQASADIAAALEKQVEELETAGAAQESLHLAEKVRDHLAALSQGAYVRGLEYYLPYLWPQPSSLADYLPADAIVLLDEPERTEENYAEFLNGIQESYERRCRSGLLLPLPHSHHLTFQEGRAKLANHQQVEISLLSRSAPRVPPTPTLPRKGGRESPTPISSPLMGEDQGGGEILLEAGPAEDFAAQVGLLVEGFRHAQQQGWRIVAATRQAQRLEELLREAGLSRIYRTNPSLNSELSTLNSQLTTDNSQLASAPGDIVITSHSLSQGFRLRGAQLVVFTDKELFGWKKPPRPGSRRKDTVSITALSQLKKGDYVVHIHHGIGLYEGLVRQMVDGAEREYLLIKYAGQDKLYVPADQFDRVQKYLGGEASPPPLNRLGGREWERTKSRAKRSAQDLAKELVALYAARSREEGFAFSADTPWQQEMEAGFPYEETADQHQAVADIKEDMEKPLPMERLVCGDVGFGKTEVAIRAAFKAVMDGKQVAVLVPTTVLAAQHFNTFRERLAPYPIRVEMLSRFRTQKEQKAIVAELAAGAIDVIIATHRLLSKDVKFKDLGLLIVDEEQRFGVRHKERLKQLRTNVDVLALTATPIPRTLHMALSGLREMSLINDPPEGRRPIRTQAYPRADALIVEAIQREVERGGQVYYVHNRVESIPHVAAHLQRLLPEARIAVGHGQMSEDALEKIMVDFYAAKYDILVCTTIIESGLDIANVNTIIVDQADSLGLAQLYQLRGRVGRSDRQACAYLLWTPHKRMTETAAQRIQAIKEFCDLGSGLKLALRDLEIRGAGNLLGPEQHGFVAAVGFDMYCQLLADAVSEIRGRPAAARPEVSLDLPVDAFIPDDWVPALNQRIELYRRLAAVADKEMQADLVTEMRDRFGDPMPAPVKNLLRLVEIKLLCMANRVARVAAKQGLLVFTLNRPRLSPAEARELRAALALEVPHARESRVEPLTVTLPFRPAAPEALFGLVEQVLKILGLLPTPEKELTALDKSQTH